jgi:8-oxo-dGTP diphosphatase
MMTLRYRNPTPTVDLIVAPDERPEAVYLIQRLNPPHGWALPGGFVDEGEALYTAAKREASEEMGVAVQILEQFHTYSDPQRDPRKHTVSTVFLARCSQRPKAGDDAVDCRLFTLEEILRTSSSPSPSLPADLEIVFDHGQILRDYFNYKSTGARPPATR